MKKSHLYAILLFICLIAACKKEEINNPDIDNVTLNFVFENTDPIDISYSNLNITGSARPDFQFSISHPNEDINQHSIALEIGNEDFEFLAYLPDDAIAIQKVNKGIEIKPSSTYWKGNVILMYHYVISGANIYEYGFSDIGDQYIAFRKKNSGGGYFYGWMLVNIENGEKITIKEYAIHKIADTSIKAGEK